MVTGNAGGEVIGRIALMLRSIYYVVINSFLLLLCRRPAIVEYLFRRFRLRLCRLALVDNPVNGGR